MPHICAFWIFFCRILQTLHHSNQCFLHFWEWFEHTVGICLIHHQINFFPAHQNPESSGASPPLPCRLKLCFRILSRGDMSTLSMSRGDMANARLLTRNQQCRPEGPRGWFSCCRPWEMKTIGGEPAFCSRTLKARCWRRFLIVRTTWEVGGLCTR